MLFDLDIPPSARTQLEEYFLKFCGNNAHMSGLIATELLLQSVLPRYVAKKLWTYGASEGRNFDLKWFRMAMFEITVWRNLRAQVNEDVNWGTGKSPTSSCDLCKRYDKFGDIIYFCDVQDNWSCCYQCSKTGKASSHKLRQWRALQLNIRYTSSGLIDCDRCRNQFQIGDCIYHCKVCRNGNFDICPACYKNEDSRCGHDLKLSLIAASRAVRWHRWIECDRCHRRFGPESQIYFCSICKRGSQDCCTACYAIPTNLCGHPLRYVTIRVMRDKGLENQKSYGSPSDLITLEPSAATKADKHSREFGELQLRDSLKGSILTEKPQVKWDDVAGLEPAKNELREAIILPIKHPQLFAGKRQPKRAILMYGPPGTGKSYLAKAIATEVDHTLFSISSSDLTSKWTGESEGLVRQLFELARDKKPSIIFIDEIDALCGVRDGPGDEHTARMKTEFLVQVDGVGKDNRGVLLLAATNRPWELDPAVRRRFQKRIHIPLPDEDARKQLFRIHGGDAARSFTDMQLQMLAKSTEGLSGSDITNASQEAMLFPIRRAMQAKFFIPMRLDGETFFMPSEFEVPLAKQMNWDDIPDGKLMDPGVKLEDFLEAVKSHKPSVAPEEIQKCHEWTQQYGSEGA